MNEGRPGIPEFICSIISVNSYVRIIRSKA